MRIKDLGRNSVDRRIDFDVEQSKVTNLLLILYFLDYNIAMTSLNDAIVTSSSRNNPILSCFIIVS